jgi:hypothetical protein
MPRPTATNPLEARSLQAIVVCSDHNRLQDAGTPHPHLPAMSVP